MVTAMVLALPTVASASSTADGDHCAVNLDTGSFVCVLDQSDLAKVVFETTGEVIVYEPGGGGTRTPKATTAYALGIIYSHPGYAGSSRTVTASNSCSGSAFSYSDLSAIGWNDDIDSFRSYGGCQTKLMENTGFSGASYGYVTSSSDVGSMANRASSIRWG